MEKHYTIGEMARIFNISTDTLRYYDKIDLIKPVKIGSNNYRYYSVKQLDLLSVIMLLRSLEVPIERVKEIVDMRDILDVSDALKKQSHIIEEKIEYLNQLKTHVMDTVERFERAEKQIGVIDTVTTPKFWFVKANAEDAADELNMKIFDEISYEVDKLWLDSVSFTVFIPKKALVSGDYGHYEWSALMTDKPYLKENDHIDTIDPTFCVYTVYEGNDHDIKSVYERLLEWIDENGFEVAGEAIEREVMTFYNRDGDNEYYLEIFIPIEENIKS